MGMFDLSSNSQMLKDFLALIFFNENKGIMGISQAVRCATSTKRAFTSYNKSFLFAF